MFGFCVPYCWTAALTFVFVNSRGVLPKDMLEHAHLSILQGRFHQDAHCITPVSVRQCWGLKHPPSMYMCDYKCKHLSCLSVGVLAEDLCALVFASASSHVCAQATETAVAVSSTKSCCFLFKKPLTFELLEHRLTSHFDLSPSQLESRLVIPSLRSLRMFTNPWACPRIFSHTCISRNSPLNLRRDK